jgi:hypothetical protein
LWTAVLALGRFDFPAELTMYFFQFSRQNMSCDLDEFQFKQASVHKQDSFLFSYFVWCCSDLLSAVDPSFLLLSAHEAPIIPRHRKARSLLKGRLPDSGLFCLLRWVPLQCSQRHTFSVVILCNPY